MREMANEADRRCCDSTRTLEDYACDFISPFLNWLLRFFNKPMSLQLLFYYGGGCLMFRYLENWDAGQSLYFLTVTATTVGYGDIVPITPMGRLFTAFFCLYGISVVLAALTPVIAILHGEWREHVLLMLGSRERVNLEDMKLTIDEVNRRIDYRHRYILAMVSPVAVLMSGIGFYYFLIREPPEPDEPYVYYGVHLMGVLEGFYFAVITMTVSRRERARTHTRSICASRSRT